MQIRDYFPSWINCLIDCMGGCFGCCNKPVIIEVDEPSKGLRIQGRLVTKASILEECWNSSSEIDDSGIQSQRSISSLSASNPLSSDPQSSTSSSSNPTEFVNHGLLLWNETRRQWLANKRPKNQSQLRESSISWNATYESLLSTTKRFSRSIPLSEMVDFLVDVWEQEGLYD